ncbi:pentapeptide repeat-containing protein, partial [Candidatus Babeliales bacterium]|nr:pentapeptide repeat-containing protein [Candidatus Babeliales bacterium]
CMKHLTLSNTQFIGANFISVDMSHANLEYATFDGAILKNVDFSNAFLIHASFKNVIFKNCKFIGSICSGTDFSGATFEGENDFALADLSDAKITGEQLQQITNLESGTLPNDKIYETKI